MISESEIERILLKFCEDWPASASIAEPVIRRIGNATEAPPHPQPLSLKGRGEQEFPHCSSDGGPSLRRFFFHPSPLEGEGPGVRGRLGRVANPPDDRFGNRRALRPVFAKFKQDEFNFAFGDHCGTSTNHFRSRPIAREICFVTLPIGRPVISATSAIE